MYLDYLNKHPYKRLSFHVEGRNGYYAIDEFINPAGDKYSGCERMVDSFKTKKQAIAVCTEMQTLASVINQLRGLS